MEAAQIAEKLRNKFVEENRSFTFETVLTSEPEVNVMRVKSRAANGGHDVPADKIYSRYGKALALIPELLQVCDICHIYDNTDTPFRIFKKRKSEYFYWEAENWSVEKIVQLVGKSAD